ncbi:imidazoleglycerol-phosphate dehydratase HisB [Bacillus sp. C1]
MRKASQVRETAETKIKLCLQLDESKNVSIQTGIGFFDHMLTLFAKHGRFGLQVEAEGDVFVDAHHTVEDVGIVLGSCLKEALQNKEGMNRYGAAYVPMDEALGFVAIDISGRSYLVYQGELKNPKLGDFDTELTEEFFRAFAHAANVTLHARILYGSNTHHKIESLFKAFGRALREAVDKNDKIVGVNSTKGLL